METAKTVDRALQVLVVVGQEGPLGVSEVAARVALNRTVTYRLLTTLQKHGFVRATARGYVPGPAVMEMARRVEPRLLAGARPAMERLSGTIGETVVLAVAQGTDAVAIDQAVATTSPLRVEYQLGTKSPLTQGASGRVLLSMIEPEIRELILDGFPDRRRLERDLIQLEQRGYATSRDELQKGIYGIAVPVVEGYLAAAISVLVPTSRADELERNLDLIIQTGHDIEENLRGA